MPTLATPSRFLVVLVLLAACAHPGRGGRGDGPSAREARKLDAVIASYTEAQKHLDAFAAPYFGLEEDFERFGDYASPEQRERARQVVEAASARLREVRPDVLAPRDRRTYRLFADDLAVSLRGFDFPFELLEFNQKSNRLLRYMDDSSPELTQFPFDSVAHYDAFLRRADGFPAYVERQIALFRRGIAEGIVLNCHIVDATFETYAPALEPVVEKNPFWRPVTVMPAGFGADDRARLTAGFRAMITDRIVPGYRTLDRFLREEYRGHCRRDFGIGTLPNGRDWYAHLIRATTNLPLSAAEIHATGLREVARIRGEMDGIRKAVGFRGSLRAFLTAWMHAPDHFFDDPRALFAAFQKVKDEVATLTPRYFSLRPKTDYDIVAASTVESAAGSYYEPTDSVPRGRFVVNTLNLDSVPRDRVPTLSLHETIPGHHFQLALVYEMKDRLSEYQRKVFGSTAFAEGWALYAEYLGREMGVYRTPMERLGNLNDEMLRAVRLVVDTGIHAYGWSRRRAIAYMTANLANDPRDVESEVDRYAVWPAQALAYKIGELEIRGLRAKAEAELGAAFDLREFHDVVLGNGTVSLPVLAEQVDSWIASQKKPPDSPRPLSPRPGGE